jgi:hypothetical protein
MTQAYLTQAHLAIRPNMDNSVTSQEKKIPYPDNHFVHYCPGVPGSSVQWGAWSGVGMVAYNKAVLARMRRGGIGSVTPAAGLAVLSTLLSCRTPPAAQVWPAIKIAVHVQCSTYTGMTNLKRMASQLFTHELDCCLTVLSEQTNILGLFS